MLPWAVTFVVASQLHVLRLNFLTCNGDKSCSPMGSNLFFKD